MRLAPRSVTIGALLTVLAGGVLGAWPAPDSHRSAAAAAASTESAWAQPLVLNAPAETSRPSRVTVTALTTGYAVSWAPGAKTSVIGYRVVRTDASGATTVVATVPATSTMYRDEAAAVGERYTYRVTAVLPFAVAETAATASPSSAAPHDGDVAREIIATERCPTPTVAVSTTAQLTAALLAAKPGDVITLAPGTYTGQFKLRNVDGGAARIWICGPSTAVLTTGGIDKGSALMLTNASNVVVHGLSFTRSQKGVTIITGSRVTLRDLTVTEVGYEAVHFRTQTVDSLLVGSRISGAGRVQPKYGEGVYVGTSGANTCTQNDCEPDRTQRVAVVDNVISETGAQPIEVKEGSVSGLIAGNRVTGALWMDEASKALILIKGNDWHAVNNEVVAVGGYGLGVIFSTGAGEGNTFSGNVVSGSPSIALWSNKPYSPAAGPTVHCSNSTVASARLSNLACVP